MPDILPFLKSGSVFEPEATRAMSVAFDEVCRALGLNADAHAKETIALRIIELARRGERDPDRLRRVVLEEAGGNESPPSA
ncbi:MAG: hypothetical protein QOC56_2239 [Alphaproteobacteria bacterium]|nr:hypothetical protein [Alphaproteobacteria bacterium]